MNMLERHLVLNNACKILTNIPANLHVGNVEYQPAEIRYLVKDGKNVVLWLSGFNHKLHIEADKMNAYTENLIGKNELLRFMKAIKFYEHQDFKSKANSWMASPQRAAAMIEVE